MLLCNHERVIKDHINEHTHTEITTKDQSHLFAESEMLDFH